ncbi:hypothetical protein ACHAWF_007656 [Thalassiosira exigua]
MIMDPWLHRNVGVQNDEGCTGDSKLLDTSCRVGDDIYRPKITEVSATTMKGADQDDTIDGFNEDPSIAPSATCADASTDYPAYQPSCASDGSTSNMTSVTIELRKAARKTICHAKSKRAMDAAIPLEVKQSLLEKEFPHIQMKNSTPHGSVDSLRAEQSVDSRISDGDVEFDDQGVDYNDCVSTLHERELLELRSSLMNYEKHRVTVMMNHLSHQMKHFHNLLDENQSLKQDISQATRGESRVSELEAKVADLEKSLIEMKLTLALCQSREDHHKMDMANLEMELTNTKNENYQLKQKLGLNVESPRSLRNSSLTKSMSSAGSPNSNVRSGETSKKKTWFGRDRSKGLSASFMEMSFQKEKIIAPTESMESNKPATRPRPTVTHRSRSFIEPAKVRASKESEFMPWGTSEKSDDDGKAAPKLTRSQSFSDSKTALKKRLIGSDICLTFHQAEDGENFDSRATFLSAITDVTFEDGSEEAQKVKMSMVEEEMKLPPKLQGEKNPYGGLDMSGSQSTLEFEAAKPQAQRAMSLRSVKHGTHEPKIQLHGSVKASPERCLGTENSVCKRDTLDKIHPRMQLQKASSLRGRKSSAGEAFLAFC